MSPELEQTLSMLSSHRSVLGYMLVTRGHHPSIIRHSGVVFEGEQGKRYAAVVARIVESVQAGLEEVRVDDGLTAAATGEADVVRGLSETRLFKGINVALERMTFDSWEYEPRNMKYWSHQVSIISVCFEIHNSQTHLSDDRYLLVVLHDPATWPAMVYQYYYSCLICSLVDKIVSV